MNYLNNEQLLSGCQADQNCYIPPEITVLEITPEKGFAASSSTADWGSLTWGN
ncbi:MAG: hypothetical protein WC128_09265 [Bacteroidales bacterium]|jgi:hypothetical protein